MSRTSPTPVPTIENALNDLEPIEVSESVPIPSEKGLAEEIPIRDKDWFERTSVEALEDALEREPELTRRRLERAIGPEQAEMLEGALRNEPTPTALRIVARRERDLPEIVLIHGILGGHLDDVAAHARRVWLSPWSLARKDLGRRLSLLPDGETDGAPGQRLEPAGLLALVYRAPALAFRRAGFVVHEFAFDWRKRIERAADRLHFFLESLSAGRPRRFALVCHSMGGLVACAYAKRRRTWKRRVERAIFIGTPLRGSLAPVEVALGLYPFIEKLALLVRDNREELRRMALTLPGLLQMLPDVEAFPELASLSATANWPAQARPSQGLLDEARAFMTAVRSSPLLERAAVIACVGRPTLDRLEWTAPNDGGAMTFKVDRKTGHGRGDGTVPARSAIVKGLPLALVNAEHAFLPSSDDTRRAAMGLLRDGRFPEDLAATPEDALLDEKLRMPEAAAPVEAPLGPWALPGDAIRVGTARERVSEELDFETMRWLLGDSRGMAPG